MNKNKYIS